MPGADDRTEACGTGSIGPVNLSSTGTGTVLFEVDPTGKGTLRVR